MNLSRDRTAFISGVGCLILLLIILLVMDRGRPKPGQTAASGNPAASTADRSTQQPGKRVIRSASGQVSPGSTAKEVVATKLKQFSQSRRAIMHAMARQKNIAVPELVERFFDAVERGDWTEIRAAFDAINGGEGNAGHGPQRTPEVQALWAPIIDAFGAAEQVHLWPAQKLLDYGHSILDQLRPGMVYVGGTDEGRWIPALLNETTEGQKHMLITQNGLADGTYLEYLRFLYADQFTALGPQDAERAFSNYIEDAGKRLAHDEQFPNEPKQIRPGEEIARVDNKITVSGRVAVMDINERLLKTLMEKNPDLAFALQESFPLKGTYADASTLGPITQLRSADQTGLTPERATESVNYWMNMAEELKRSPDPEKQDTPLKAYSKLAVGQANLFAERGLPEQAEQTYRAALGMLGNNTDAALGLANLLERTGRTSEAQSFMTQFARDYPKQFADMQKLRRSGSITFQRTSSK